MKADIKDAMSGVTSAVNGVDITAPVAGTEKALDSMTSGITDTTNAFSSLQDALATTGSATSSDMSTVSPTSIDGLTNDDWRKIEAYKAAGSTVSIMSPEQYAAKHNGQKTSELQSTFSAKQTSENTNNGELELLRAIERNTAAMAVFGV